MGLLKNIVTSSKKASGTPSTKASISSSTKAPGVVPNDVGVTGFRHIFHIEEVEVEEEEDEEQQPPGEMPSHLPRSSSSMSSSLSASQNTTSFPSQATLTPTPSMMHPRSSSPAAHAHAHAHTHAPRQGSRRRRRAHHGHTSVVPILSQQSDFVNVDRGLLYHPVRPRQRWDEPQIIPHVEWGDLFHDLFFVALVFAVAKILAEVVRNDVDVDVDVDVTVPVNRSVVETETIPRQYYYDDCRPLLYFVATFGCASQIWDARIRFDAKYVTGKDLVHRALEAMQLCAVAFAVLCLSSTGTVTVTGTLGRPAEYANMLGFAVAVGVDGLVEIVRTWEVRCCRGDVGGGSRPATASDLRRSLVRWSFLVAAAVVAGMDFFGGKEAIPPLPPHEGGGLQRWSNEDEEEGVVWNNATNYDNPLPYDDSSWSLESGNGNYNIYRLSDTITPYNDLPMWLCLASTVVSQVLLIFDFRFFYSRRDDVMGTFVPMNIDYMIHRYGEWIMLMLGQNILSLVIVGSNITGNDDNGGDVPMSVALSLETAGWRVYVTFFACVLSVTLLQYQHFQSQPHRADDHAVRRDRHAGVWWSTLHHYYSASLVALGVSCTLLFHHEINEVSSNGSHKWDGNYDDRRLALLFCGSLALSSVLLDLMTLLHRGLWANLRQCRRRRRRRAPKKPCAVDDNGNDDNDECDDDDDEGRGCGVNVDWTTLALVTVKLLWLGGVVTLGFFVTDPVILVLAGLGLHTTAVAWRLLASVYYNHGPVGEDDHSEADDDNDDLVYYVVASSRGQLHGNGNGIGGGLRYQYFHDHGGGGDDDVDEYSSVRDHLHRMMVTTDHHNMHNSLRHRKGILEDITSRTDIELKYDLEQTDKIS